MKKDLNAQLKRDIKTVSDVMISPETSEGFYKTTKRELLTALKDGYKIRYYMSTDVFRNKRPVIVIY